MTVTALRDTLARAGLATLVILLAACAGTLPGAAPHYPAPAAPAPFDGQARGEAYRIQWGLVIHGGAGTITRESMTPDVEAQYHAVLEQALRAGHSVLAAGGSGLDAVVAANVIMEDSPLFNAGRGAVFTAEGRNELDASIMDGATLQAGAVAGVMRVKNPIILARRVMDSSPHVMLAREGAEEFAQLQGVELVDPSYFHTESRWRALERARAAEAARQSGADTPSADDPASRYGTVGAVALARDGTIAAGTSTGGMTNKRWGRVGDVPIIGAGTYADGQCGVSTTGWGEYFIINVVAHDICARMRYRGITLAQAADEVVWERLEAQQPETGGIISLDAGGNVVMTFNSRGMYRGYIDQDGRVHTAIFR
jgi:L-asparaginase / beta-aspartyl-peptidase